MACGALRVLRVRWPAQRVGEELPPQLLAPLLCPLLVAVLGQEITYVQLDRRPVSRRLAFPKSCCGGLLEGLDIHPQLTWHMQQELLILGCKVAVARRWVESPARAE